MDGADLDGVADSRSHSARRATTASGNGGDTVGSTEMGVRGYACELFDDPATAWALHQESHLIPWRGDASELRVDRFDARNLLDDHAQFRQLKKLSRKRKLADVEGQEEASGGSELGGIQDEATALLHRLRYGDYSVEFPPEEPPPAENRFPYQYPEDDAVGSEEESDGESFTPPWEVPADIKMVTVPSIQKHVCWSVADWLSWTCRQPKTHSRHAVILATADKARGNSQLEVLMKVGLRLRRCTTKLHFLTRVILHRFGSATTRSLGFSGQCTASMRTTASFATATSNSVIQTRWLDYPYQVQVLPPPSPFPQQPVCSSLEQSTRM